MIAVLVFAFALVAAVDMPGLVRDRHWRELLAFGVIMSIAFMLGILVALRIDIPPVNTAITHLVRKLLGTAAPNLR